MFWRSSGRVMIVANVGVCSRSCYSGALDQCGNAVNARQRFMSRDFGSKDDMRIVLKPIVLQRCVNCRSVSAHSAAWCDVFLYKGHDCVDGGPRNALKTNTPEA